jgi:hypothetical protein
MKNRNIHVNTQFVSRVRQYSILAVLFFGLALGGVKTLQPTSPYAEKVQAGFPTSELLSVPALVNYFVEKPVAETIKQAAFQIAQQQIINAINGKGIASPVELLTDYKDYIIDQAWDQTFKDIDFLFDVDLCHGIDKNIRLAILESVGPIESAQAAAECTFDAIVTDPDNWSTLTDGWNVALTQVEHNNNVIGAYVFGKTYAISKQAENERLQEQTIQDGMISPGSKPGEVTADIHKVRKISDLLEVEGPIGQFMQQQGLPVNFLTPIMMAAINRALTEGTKHLNQSLESLP